MIFPPDKAAAVLAKLGGDPEADQQILAPVTGQYRMGNERNGRSKRR